MAKKKLKYQINWTWFTESESIQIVDIWKLRQFLFISYAFLLSYHYMFTMKRPSIPKQKLISNKI